jgi:hypothetical protein
MNLSETSGVFSIERTDNITKQFSNKKNSRYRVAFISLLVIASICLGMFIKDQYEVSKGYINETNEQKEEKYLYLVFAITLLAIAMFVYYKQRNA